MSGRPKHPVTDAEQLRQLTREAHEAIQGLQEVRREIRDARAALRQEFRDSAVRAADVMAAATRDLTAHMEVQAREVNRHMSELLRADSFEDLANMIVAATAAELAKYLTLALDNKSGLPVITPHPAEPAGYITVTDDPANAPPGSIVMDIR